MKLYYREFGEDRSQPPIMLLHGLLGSLVNWQRIARKLAEQRWVIVPDLRNHGRSPHDSDVSYEAMTSDLLELMDDLAVEQVVPAGHSMGGKAAMWLALTHPQRIERLVVVDIAPVTYQGSLAGLLDALLALPLQRLEKRRQADAWLQQQVPESAIRDYLLQNLVRGEAGWQWRSNLRALRDGLELISAFPESSGARYLGPALFVHGAHSSYVKPEYLPRMKALFPGLQLVSLDAGHWVYAEQPEQFLEALQGFLAV